MRNNFNKNNDFKKKNRKASIPISFTEIFEIICKVPIEYAVNEITKNTMPDILSLPLGFEEGILATRMILSRQSV